MHRMSKLVSEACTFQVVGGKVATVLAEELSAVVAGFPPGVRPRRVLLTCLRQHGLATDPRKPVHLMGGTHLEN
jgi:hypothetical protein